VGRALASPMMRKKTMMRPVLDLVGLVLLLPALPGCGNDGGGGGSGAGTDDGGGTGGESDGADDESAGDPPGPDPQGDQCGGDIHGWETLCFIEDLEATASDGREILGLPPVGGHTARTLCCEGHPSIAEANAGCDGYCMLEICEAALAAHLAGCQTCAWKNCGFDMTDCLDGGAHDQTLACFSPPYYGSYTLTTSCTAFDNEPRNPDGSFAFLEQPIDVQDTAPPVCNPTSDLELDPPRGLGQYAGSAADGTEARLRWSMADMSGQERSEDLGVSFEYAIMPCTFTSTDCMALTNLELTLPTTTALGMTITKARLSVVAVEEAPMIEHGEHFRFSDGSLRVLMQAHVDGIPLVLAGTNVGSPSGHISPDGDQFSISGLRFEHVDSVISAALEIDIQGQYDARRPNAQITRTSAPDRCDEPVSFLATSWDADEDPLVHTWWIRDIGSFSGPLLELPLPAGEHDVMLTSRDASGLFDAETLRYARTCR
jgi:hypothetical protein